MTTRVVLGVAVLAAGIVPAAARAQSDSAESALLQALPKGWVIAAPVQRDGIWAASTAIRPEPDNPAGESAEAMLLIARRTTRGWRGLAADTQLVAEFNDWVNAAPDTLLPEDAKAYFQLDEARIAAASGMRAQSAAAFVGHRLPYPGGWTAIMTQGPYGAFSHRDYWAIDWVLPTTGAFTSTIVASKAGVVMYVKDVSGTGGLGSGYSGYSNGVVIRHGPGEYSWYWHLAKNSVPEDVQPGMPIERGAVVGLMGSTGYSSGAHLHYHVSKSFVWAGCSAVTGCPARETRVNRAPWNKDTDAVDFEDAPDENAWLRCDGRASCNANLVSSNALDATDGAVLYWARSFVGPGWKRNASYAGNVPDWLRGRASSLAMPPGWQAHVYEQPDLQGVPLQISTSAITLPFGVNSLSVTPGITRTKRLRNDLPVEWPYLIGGDDANISAIAIDGQVVAGQPCAWAAQALSPGMHTVSVLMQGGGALPPLRVERWPFVAPACPLPVMADPGLPPTPATQTCAPLHEVLEPNDGPASAVTLTLGLLQTHTTSYAGDADWAVFTATGGLTYTLLTTQLEPDADTVLELYDTTGTTVLRSNDDAFGYASRIVWSPPSTGTYYARVLAWDPGIAQCGTGYALSLVPGAHIDGVWLPFLVR